MSTDDFSRADARRIVLAAQGFDRPRPRRPGRADLRRLIHRLGLVQLDFVTVVAPAHYLVPFARLGPYDRNHLDDLVYRRREFIEAWAHEASLVPIDAWPLLQYRRDSHRIRPDNFEPILAQLDGYLEAILNEVRSRGPLCAPELAAPEGVQRRIPGSWHSVPRAALEAHFGRGILAIADRRPDFARVYDLAERIIPTEHHSRPAPHADGKRELLRRAARASGVATAADLADYFRMKVGEARPRLAELVEAGELKEVRVEGWREPAYLHREARLPRQVEAQALLAPFDPLIWFRPRTARLFDFDYRFEIFVPAARRRWGCYVLPFLQGDRLTARVDLKTDRPGRCLRVLSADLERGMDAAAVVPGLAAELRSLAAWLGLNDVVVVGAGRFDRTLRSAL